MSDIHLRYPDKKCDDCGRLGCVFLDNENGCAGVRAEYLCLDCTKKRGHKPHWLEDAPLSEASKYTREERHEIRRKNRQLYAAELFRQSVELVRLDFHREMRMNEDEFHRNMSAYSRAILELEDLPLNYEKLDSFPLYEDVQKAGNIPLVLVIPGDQISCRTKLQLACAKNDSHYAPDNVGHVQNAFNCPYVSPYLLMNVSPNGKRGHMKLSIDEGASLVVQFFERFLEWQILFCAASNHLHPVPSDVLLVAKPWITQNRNITLMYMPERRMLESKHGQATCERRLMLSNSAGQMRWLNIEGPKLF